jgi:predicted nucleic acid-binding Zn ribbon protein
VTYTYGCLRCGRTVEREQRITDPLLREPCPACLAEGFEGRVMARVVTGGNGFRLRGEGWTSKGRV